MKLTSKHLLACVLLAPSAHALDLIAFDATWDYMHPIDYVDPALADADFNSTWFLAETPFGANYDGPEFGASPAISGPSIDSGTGPAPFAYGDVSYVDDELGGIATLLSTPDEDERATAYFRHTFTVSEDVDYMAIEILADDGAVIYLDGQLLTKINFSKTDTYFTESTRNSQEDETRYVTGDLGNLSAGAHTLAVSVHQEDEDSSDLGFALRLSDDGFATQPMGITDFDDTESFFFLNEELTGWISESPTRFLLRDEDGGILRSNPIDISGRDELLFTMDFILDETSGSSNYEDDDTFSAWIELDDGNGNMTTLSLIPTSLDPNHDGILSGDEFGPGFSDEVEIYFLRPLIAKIPSGFASATLVVEAANDSSSERFRLENALLRDAPAPGISLGTVEIGDGSTIPLLLGPGLWEGDAASGFVLNDADAFTTLMTESIDISGLAQITMTLTASIDSSSSNFEDSDTFTAWVETIDDDGGIAIPLIVTDNDIDGDYTLKGDEFAPGEPDEATFDNEFFLSAELPRGTTSARIIIVAINNSGSESFSISDVKVSRFIPLSDTINITAITVTEGEIDLTWQSASGETYDLQFSPDLSADSFTTVATVFATGASTSSTHTPGTGEGFYRIMLQQP